MVTRRFIVLGRGFRSPLRRPPVVPRWLLIIIIICVCATVGCGPSRPPALTPPALNPAAVAEAVFERGALDADGRLSADERLNVPAIASISAELDEDGDEAVSKAEVLRWLERVKESRVALASLSVVVQQGGQPVSNAKVRLIPDPAMGDAIQEAEGTTDGSGMAVMSAVGAASPGVNCGLYAISVIPAGEGSIDAAESARFGIAVGAGLPVGYQTVIDID